MSRTSIVDCLLTCPFRCCTDSAVLLGLAGFIVPLAVLFEPTLNATGTLSSDVEVALGDVEPRITLWIGAPFVSCDVCGETSPESRVEVETLLEDITNGGTI